MGNGKTLYLRTSLSSAFSCPVASGGYMISLLRVCDLRYATLHIYDAVSIEQ